MDTKKRFINYTWERRIKREKKRKCVLLTYHKEGRWFREGQSLSRLRALQKGLSVHV